MAMLDSRQIYRIKSEMAPSRLALLVGIVAVAISLIGYFTNRAHFFHSYLTAFAFWLTIALGGLFFTMLHHLTAATWSVVVRRIAENIMAALPAAVILFIPAFFGIGELYHWSHKDIVAQDAILQHKSAFLNTGFFIIRTVIYSAVWIFLALILYRTSLAQDSYYSEDRTARMKRISAVGMVLFALTLTFAAFDWLMSLDAHWYSTIFGVYIFAGSLVSILAFMTLTSLELRSRGILTDIITVEHYNDLGKLMFAFTIFWGYIAFSQYFLIWYANIPEETIWYHERWGGLWQVLGLLLVFGHFVIPFVVLISRAAKRNFMTLKIISVWILLMHWVDLYWIIMPGLDNNHAFRPSWMDLTLMIGLGGLFMWYFWRQLASQPLVPVNDPRLEASINFLND